MELVGLSQPHASYALHFLLWPHPGDVSSRSMQKDTGNLAMKSMIMSGRQNPSLWSIFYQPWSTYIQTKSQQHERNLKNGRKVALPIQKLL